MPARPTDLPASVAFVVEVTRGAWAKRGPDGRVEFPSPVPCPFNYGSAPAHPSADGEPADVVVLGAPLARGTRGTLPLVGRVRFRDAGLTDDKWICAAHPPGRRDRARLRAFFTLYAFLKRVTAPARRTSRDSRFEALELFDAPDR